NTTSAPIAVNIKNTGTADLVLSAVTLAGTNSADFALTAPPTPITIAPGTSKQISLTFTPGSTGARSATVTVTHNAAGSPAIINANGVGIAPAIDVAPTTVNFGNQLINTPSAATTITIHNTGTADLTVSSIALSGAQPGDFTLSTPSLPLTIPAT